MPAQPSVNISAFRVPLQLWNAMETRRLAGGYPSQAKWLRHLIDQELARPESQSLPYEDREAVGAA